LLKKEAFDMGKMISISGNYINLWKQCCKENAWSFI